MRLFWNTIILLAIVLVLNFIATKFYLHWTDWWYDASLHFLAGSTVAMATILFLQYFFDTTKFKLLEIILLSVLVCFVVGILWELYELQFGITHFSRHTTYIMGTSSDLIMDICGGFFGVLYAKKFLSKSNE